MNAQLKEHFDTLEAWKFDTAQWENLDGKLHSTCKISNNSFEISTTNTLVTNCVWKINCNFKFATSSLNYVDFYLLADNAKVSTATNAYFLRIGSTDDDICLYKKNNSLLIKLIDGLDGKTQANGNNNQIQVKVCRQGNGHWLLYTDNAANAIHYTLEGSAEDSAFTQGDFTGLVVHQSTASFFAKHYFDDVLIQTLSDDSLDTSSLDLPIPKAEVCISEILFNPFPNAVDFVEIFNGSSHAQALSQLYLANEKGDTIDFKASAIFIAPNSYVAITIDTTKLNQFYPYYAHKNGVQVAKLPSMNDEEGYCVLLNADKQILDSITYTEKMHVDLINNNEGVSLEKINLALGSQKDNWHSASSTVGYASPGNVNSQNQVSIPIASIFNASSKVLSPNQDGYHDFVLLQYQMFQTGTTATIDIYNMAGELERQLVANHLLGMSGIYQWDGTNTFGEKVANGYYLIRIDLLHHNGNAEIVEIPIAVWVE